MLKFANTNHFLFYILSYHKIFLPLHQFFMVLDLR